MRRRILLLPFLAGALGSFGSPAPDTLLFTPGLPQRPLGEYLHILRDSSGLMTAGEAMFAGFAPANAAVPNLDITPDAFWVKLLVRNASPHADIILSVPHAEIDEIDIHLASSDGVRHIASAGQSRPRSRQPA